MVAEYPYIDEDGEVLFIKERREPKDFRIKTPDGRPGKNGARSVLYRLPEVLAAVADGRPVYVVEGEKDADALARLGHVATCNFEGAAKPGQRPKWRPEYGDVLPAPTSLSSPTATTPEWRTLGQSTQTCWPRPRASQWCGPRSARTSATISPPARC